MVSSDRLEAPRLENRPPGPPSHRGQYTKKSRPRSKWPPVPTWLRPPN